MLLSFILFAYAFHFCMLNGLCSSSECHKNPYIRDAGPLVETNSGTVVGKYVKVFDTDVAAFLGIPYAKPPLGDKRFAKPEPIETWEDTLFANERSPSCMQYSTREYPWIPSEKNATEDCLYLNIWMPIKCCCSAFNKLPVLVWLHGGGFYSGSSNMNSYDGSIMVSYGDVIVVSINYRVGVFGFINGGIEGASGNAGLFDQLFALKWIKENIHHFGGDTSSITLFGESAGGMSINSHLVSPLSRDLFQKVIMQSGVFYHPHLVDETQVAMFKANTFAEIAGCKSESGSPSEIINCLKSKDAFELAQAENMLTSKFPLFFIPSFGNGNEFLPENPLKVIRSGEFAQIPILIGTNKDEGAIFLTYLMPDIFARDRKANLTLLQAKHILRGLFAAAPEVSPEVVFDFYFRNITQDGGDDLVTAISNSFGDYTFNCPTLYLAEKSNEAFLYWNTHRSLKHKDDEWLGVSHFDEISFVFGKPIIDTKQFTPEDVQFSNNLIQKWSTFARNGNPISSENPETWPKFSLTNPVAYELNPRSPNRILHPRLEACEFWRPYIEVQSS